MAVLLLALSLPSLSLPKQDVDVDWRLVYESVKGIKKPAVIRLTLKDVEETVDGVADVFLVDRKNEQKISTIAFHPKGVGSSSFVMGLNSTVEKFNTTLSRKTRIEIRDGKGKPVDCREIIVEIIEMIKSEK